MRLINELSKSFLKKYVSKSKRDVKAANREWDDNVSDDDNSSFADDYAAALSHRIDRRERGQALAQKRLDSPAQKKTKTLARMKPKRAKRG